MDDNIDRVDKEFRRLRITTPLPHRYKKALLASQGVKIIHWFEEETYERNKERRRRKKKRERDRRRDP